MVNSQLSRCLLQITQKTTTTSMIQIFEIRSSDAIEFHYQSRRLYKSTKHFFNARILLTERTWYSLFLLLLLILISMERTDSINRNIRKIKRKPKKMCLKIILIQILLKIHGCIFSLFISVSFIRCGRRIVWPIFQTDFNSEKERTNISGEEGKRMMVTEHERSTFAVK